MKRIVGLSILLALCLSLHAEKPKKENNLFGYWKLIKAETNGRPNPENMMDRTFMYDEKGNFEGKIFMNGQEMPFNSGMFFLPNDTTMICIHYNSPGGKLSQLAFTYNFHVRKDSLHIYGIYFTNTKERRDLLQMNFINEWWVKPSVLIKK